MTIKREEAEQALAGARMGEAEKKALLDKAFSGDQAAHYAAQLSGQGIPGGKREYAAKFKPGDRVKILSDEEFVSDPAGGRVATNASLTVKAVKEIRPGSGSWTIQVTDGKGWAWVPEFELAKYAASSQQSALPGGAYAAEQAADGSWTVRDVPIFAQHEVPLADGKRTAKVDAAWLQAAVEKSRERESGDKYLAPVHVRHHGGAQPTEPAGFFRPTRVGQMQYEGRKVAVLFADLVGVPDVTYQEMKLGRLPYRSVEVHDIGKPEVNSLALLQDEVPFFRLPMLTIGAERPSVTTSVAACAVKYAPMLAFAEAGPAAGAYLYSEASMRKYGGESPVFPGDIEARIDALKKKLAKLKGSGRVEEEDEISAEIKELSKRMKGSAMPDEKEKKPEDDKSVKAGAETDTAPSLVTCPDCGGKAVLDGKPCPTCAGSGKVDENEGEFKAADADSEPDNIVKMDAAAGDDMGAKLDRILALLTQLCGSEETPVTADAAPEDAPAAGTPAAMHAQAKLDAKFTALAGKVKTLEAERETERLVKLAAAETRGLSVGDDLEATIRKYAAKGGEPAVRIYLDAVKAVAVKDPPDKGEADDSAILPPEVVKYQAQGPEATERAIKYSAEYDAQKKYTTLTRERFIAARFSSESMSASANS